MVKVVELADKEDCIWEMAVEKNFNYEPEVAQNPASLAQPPPGWPAGREKTAALAAILPRDLRANPHRK